MGKDCSQPLRKRGDSFAGPGGGGEGLGGWAGRAGVKCSQQRRRTWGSRPQASRGCRRAGSRCGRSQRRLPGHGPRRPHAGPGRRDSEAEARGPRHQRRGWGGAAGAFRTGRRRQDWGRKRLGGGPERRSPVRYPAHRASILNDDLLGEHDTAVRGPFLFLPLGHFTILESWRCCSHSRDGRPQRRVPSRHYCRAKPLGAPAAILRARPASGGASHRAIGRRARPAHVTPPHPLGRSAVVALGGSREGSDRAAGERPEAAGRPETAFTTFTGSLNPQTALGCRDR